MMKIKDTNSRINIALSFILCGIVRNMRNTSWKGFEFWEIESYLFTIMKFSSQIIFVNVDLIIVSCKSYTPLFLSL